MPKTTPHPLALGGSRPKKSSTGRPRKEGERFPNGRLKPQPPNPIVLAARQALGVTDPRKPCTPLLLAFERGWISDVEYGTGRAYAGVYRRAQLCSPGAITVSDTSIQAGVEDVPDVKWSEMSRKMIAQIWDSAFRDVGTYEGSEATQERAARAMQRWKQMSAAMTADERSEVDLVCLRESWPQWILQRAAGRFETSWERKRDLLLSGLSKMTRKIETPAPANDDDAEVRSRARTPGPRRVEETIYVDQDGNELFRAERTVSKPAA